MSRITGDEGALTMHRVQLAWRPRPVVPVLARKGDGGGGAAPIFQSHDTAELRGCGEGGKDGTAVVHTDAPNPIPYTLHPIPYTSHPNLSPKP